MKSFIFFLLGLFIFSLFSCSKDEETVDTNTELLTGTWNLVEFTYDGYSDTRLSGEMFHTEYSGVAKNIDVTYSFNRDGAFEAEGSYDILLQSSGYTQLYRDIEVTSSGRWSLTGNTINITDFIGVSNVDTEEAPTETEMTIHELTENRLVLDVTQETTITEEEDEAFISTSGRYVLTR